MPPQARQRHFRYIISVTGSSTIVKTVRLTRRHMCSSCKGSTYTLYCFCSLCCTPSSLLSLKAGLTFLLSLRTSTDIAVRHQNWECSFMSTANTIKTQKILITSVRHRWLSTRNTCNQCNACVTVTSVKKGTWNSTLIALELVQHETAIYGRLGR